MEQYVTKSEEDTKKFAYHLAQQLKIGDTLVLTGDLGAGKTKFTEGILTYFGLENEISSPTFTIVNEYQTPNFPIYHFDVYRLSDVDEFYAIGGEEYFQKGVCILEWGETIAPALPSTYIQITISKDQQEENTRIIEVKKIENT